jgi:hypothetical protein
MIQLMVVETVTLSAEGAYSDLGCFLSETILTYFYFRSITFFIFCSSRGFIGLCNKRVLSLGFQEKPIKDLFAVVFQYEFSLAPRTNGVCQ